MAGVVDPAPGLVTPIKGGDDLEALDGFLLALHGQVPLALIRLDHLAQLYFLLSRSISSINWAMASPHTAAEIIAEAFPKFAPQQLVLDDLAAVQVAELVERPRTRSLGVAWSRIDVTSFST